MEAYHRLVLTEEQESKIHRQKHSKKLAFAVLCLLIPVITVAAIVTFLNQNQSTVEPNEMEVVDLVFWNMGTNAELETIYDQAQTSKIFETKSLEISSFEANPDVKSSILSRTSVIMIDGNWLIQNNNEALDRFLNATIKDVGAVIVVGESTSNLYVVLDRAGIYKVARYDNGDLNPAGNSPFAAGFCLKPITENEKERYVGGIFSCISANGVDLIENIESFVKYY